MALLMPSYSQTALAHTGAGPRHAVVNALGPG
jgi:hypothetical protein